MRNHRCTGPGIHALLMLIALAPMASKAAVVSVGAFESTLTSGLLNGFTDCGNPPGFECQVTTYDTLNNLAFSGNSGVDAVGSSAGFGPRHQERYANDGYYGNGSSWIGTGTQTWLKLDLGLVASLDTLTFGRNRVTACCGDRTASRGAHRDGTDGRRVCNWQ
jgi:hypothetical protein